VKKLIASAFLIICALTVSCSGDASAEQKFTLSEKAAKTTAKKAIANNDSIGHFIDQSFIPQTLPGINSLMEYINTMVNDPSGNQFTNQQLGQIVGHFRINDPTIHKIVEQGKKYPDQGKAKQIWSEIYSEYGKSDKTKFAKQVTEYGDIFHLNGVLQNWASRNSGNGTAQQITNDKTLADLEVLSRKGAAMETVRASNAKKIKDAITEILRAQADKINKDGGDLPPERIENAVNRIMNEYVASGYDWTKIRNNPTLERNVKAELGYSLIKNTEGSRDRSWWEYIPGIYITEEVYDLFAGNRKNVEADWINDIMNF